MSDLQLHHTFYALDEADEIANLLHKQGLYNVCEFIKRLNQDRLDAQEEAQGLSEYNNLRDEIMNLRDRLEDKETPENPKEFKQYVKDLISDLSEML